MTCPTSGRARRRPGGKFSPPCPSVAPPLALRQHTYCGEILTPINTVSNNTYRQCEKWSIFEIEYNQQSKSQKSKLKLMNQQWTQNYLPLHRVPMVHTIYYGTHAYLIYGQICSREGQFLLSGNINQHIIREIYMIGIRSVLFTYRNVTSRYTF